MSTAEIAVPAGPAVVSTQDRAEQGLELAINDQVRAEGLARAVHWRNGIRSDAAYEASHLRVSTGLDRIYFDHKAAAMAEVHLVRFAEKRGIAASLDLLIRKPHRLGRLKVSKAAARDVAREIAPHVCAILLERTTLSRAGSSVDRTPRPVPTPADLRRDREERALRAAARERLRAAATRRVGRTADGSSDLLPHGRNVLARDAKGTIAEYLSEEPAPARTIYPYSDIITRTTYAADRRGVPRIVPAEEALRQPQLRAVSIPLPHRGDHFAFSSPRALLPGESTNGLRGRTIPYPVRPQGRPQSQRFHTCVACSYAKFSVHARNYSLCKDCHRTIGMIPTEMFTAMTRDLERRGLLERRAESFGHTRSFAKVAEALAARWRTEHLRFGTSAGQPYILYPQSDIATRRTIAADVDGGPILRRDGREPGRHTPAEPVYVPAADAYGRDLYPVRGTYPLSRLDDIDISSHLGSGLALSEDELMISGARTARAEQSPFEQQPDIYDDGHRSGAARLSDFGDQRPIELNKGTGLSKEQISALSDRVETAAALRGTALDSGSREDALEPGAAGRAVERHNRGHADPLFHAGPHGDELTSHALAGALTPELRKAALEAAYDRDWSEAHEQNARWERRRAFLGISPKWRDHNDWSGPFQEITPPDFNKTYSGPTGVDESLGKFETNDFISTHRKQVDGWLAEQHDERVHNWLARHGIHEDPTRSARAAQAIRDGKEGIVLDWVEARGVPRARYEAERTWLDEVNPTVFHRTYELNPGDYSIGDLTPDTPIVDRLRAQEASRVAEAQNWARHGGALSRAQARAAVAEYKDATAPKPDPLLPPTLGEVAEKRGGVEAPRDAANARARLSVAAERFETSAARVFEDPPAFMRLFSTASPGDRAKLLAGLRTEPSELEARFGFAARLRGSGRQETEVATDVDPAGRLAAGARRPQSDAAEAALAAREFAEARRELRRVIRTVAESRGLPEAVHETRINFRAATLGAFQDPDAFHRVFDRAPLAEKRALLTMLATNPELLEERIGAAGRLANLSRVVDPRWEPLAVDKRTEVRERAATAAAHGASYVSSLTRHAGAIRTALREGRDEARAIVTQALAKHFPDAREIDAHVRLSSEMDRLSAESAEHKRALAHLDRSFDRLVATANEFRQQLKAVVVDPGAFLEGLKQLRTEEKHRVFDLMQQSPARLAEHSQMGQAARWTDQAPRLTALVAAHGRHYVERTVQFRAQLAATARSLQLPESAARSAVRKALQQVVGGLDESIGRLTAQREALPQPNLGAAAAQWRTLDSAERVHAAGAFPHLARAMRAVETAREVGESGIGRQKRSTALKEHSGQHRARNRPPAGLEL